LDDLYADLDVEAAELLWFLLHRRVPIGFNPSRELQEAPPTAGAIDQLLQGQQGAVLAWWFDCLKLGELSVGCPDRGTHMPFLTAGGEQFKTSVVLDGFVELVKANPELARHGDYEDLGVKFKGLHSVNQLTRNFDGLFGRGGIPNVNGIYNVPGLGALRRLFATHALGAPGYRWV